MTTLLAQALHEHFTAWDWLIVAGYLAVTTVLGGALAGKQASIRDFFLGGRKLPWYAVAGSIVATEISAVTFVGVPAIVFAAGGNMTYLQLVLGTVIARIIIGYVFVPLYYKHEIYSPYDAMGQALGPRVQQTASAIFMLGGILAQSVRVLLTAVILQLVSGIPLVYSIWIIGAVAVAWTWMGGISTVIWTDLILFGVFFGGTILALVWVVHALPNGFADFLHIAGDAGKFQTLDLSTDPTVAYTLWAGLVGYVLLSLNAFGTDQLIAQRMFCCRGPREARRAIIASNISVLISLAALLVGAGLYAYYQLHPLTGEAEALVHERVDRIFPVFILQVIPTGVSGILVAGIFAAAISSLDSILAALSQTSITTFYEPWLRRRNPKAADNPQILVWASRITVLLWGVLLCFVAQLAEFTWDRYREILNLALAMAGYTGGALLAGFVIVLLRIRIDGSGYVWAAPISVMAVFAASWHQWGAQSVCVSFAVVIAVLWIAARLRDGGLFSIKTAALLIAAMSLPLICRFGYFTRPSPTDPTHLVERSIAWPWYVPIGFTVALVLTWLLSNRTPAKRT